MNLKNKNKIWRRYKNENGERKTDKTELGRDGYGNGGINGKKIRLFALSGGSVFLERQ